MLCTLGAQAAPRRANAGVDAEPMLVHIPLAPTTASPATATATVGAAAPSPTRMHTQVFKPAGPGPFKVLLYAHGRPGYASQRALLKRPIHARHVQYWLAKGYAVVAPIRPGYGATAALTPRAPAQATPPAANASAAPSPSAPPKPQPAPSAKRWTGCASSPGPEPTALC